MSRRRLSVSKSLKWVFFHLCFSKCLLEVTSVKLTPVDENNQVTKWEIEPQTYGVIVDCGSSGTRAHIYQWDTSLNYPELLHHIEKSPNQEDSKPINPGLSSLADATPAEMHAYIKQVADYVAKKIPESRHPFTVIYIMATAGMRLLDEPTQETIMNEISWFIRTKYNFRKVETSVISGGDEGMYRWISVNSKAKRFLEPSTNGKTKTYGVVEMGGASVQVVYQQRAGVGEIIAMAMPKNLRSTYLDQVVTPQISRRDDPNHEYKLHSTTFLGFGGDSAYQAYLDLLIRKRYSPDFIKSFLSSSKKVFNRFLDCFSCSPKNKSPHSVSDEKQLKISDPCAPMGWNLDGLKKPTRMLNSKEKTIGFIVDDDDEREKGGVFSLSIKGTGNYNKCKKYVESMLWTAKREGLNCEPHEKCTMSLLGSYFVPFHTIDFKGVGDVYHSTNTMLDMAGIYNHKNIATKTKEICNSSLEELEERYPDIANSSNKKIRERIHTECFRAVWVDTLLVKGLRLPETHNMLETIDKVHGDDPEWTLGAVLDKSLAIEVATEKADKVESNPAVAKE